MKITKSLVLSLFLLAFSTTFPSSSFLASAIHSGDDHLPEPVFDVNGQALRAGGLYYVEVKGPESARAFSTNQACPDRIILSRRTKFPVRISPGTSEDAFIREDTYQTIKFDMGYNCLMIMSLVWGERHGESLLWPRGDPERDQFVITKYKDEKYTYQLSYCKRHSGIRCSQLGYVLKNGVPYVSTDGLSFPVVFRPALEPRQMIKEVASN